MNAAMQMKSEKTINLISISSLFILNIVLKSIFSGTNTIDIDEPYTIYHAQGSLHDLFIVLKGDNNPPLFFVLLHFWVKLFGISPGSARFLPMLFSSMAVPFIFLIGKKYYGIYMAIGASLLYTFSNLNIMEAHDTRAYSLFVLLSCMSMYFYFSVIDSERKTTPLIFLTITNVLLMYTHILACFLILTQAGYSLLIPEVRRSIFKKHLLSLVILAFAYLPYLLLFILERMIIKLQEGMPFEKSRPSHLYSSVWAFCNYNLWVTNLILAVLFIFIVLALFKWRKISYKDIMVMGWFVFPYLLMYLISYKFAIAIPKYMIFITPGFYLAVAVASSNLVKNKKIIGPVLIFIIVLLMASTTDLKSSNYSGSAEAVSVVMKNKTDSTAVFLEPPWISLTFAYHHDLDAFKDYGWYTYKRLMNQNIYSLWYLNDLDSMDLNLFSDAVLVIGNGNGGIAYFDPEGKIYRVLLEKFKTVKTIARYDGYIVYHFGTKRSSGVSKKIKV